jgi:hypothetical protein
MRVWLERRKMTEEGNCGNDEEERILVCRKEGGLYTDLAGGASD